nr:basic leucine zipper 19-like [Tanacetum cinerariifolium]
MSDDHKAPTDDTTESPDKKEKNYSKENREAMKKCQERKKAWAASLEDEVVRLRALNQQPLQHLPLSSSTNPLNPGRLVAGDTFPGRHVARDKSNEKARRGYVPGRLTRATSSVPHSFSQTINCHGGGFSRNPGDMSPGKGFQINYLSTLAIILPISGAFPGRHVARDRSPIYTSKHKITYTFPTSPNYRPHPPHPRRRPHHPRTRHSRCHHRTQAFLTLFELSDIGGVRAWRRGRNDRALSRQYPSNTENVPPLLALANNGHDLILSVWHTRGGVGV